MRRVYLDSCVVIYQVENIKPWAPLIDAESVRVPTVCCISELVMLECLVLPLRVNDAQVLSAYDGFFARCHVLQLEESSYRRAAAVRAISHLKTPDALHVAAAELGKCDEFWTNDQRLQQALAVPVRVFP